MDLHETDPFNGKVVSEELNLKDLRMMKDANVNLSVVPITHVIPGSMNFVTQSVCM